MLFDPDSCGSTRAEESFYLSTVLTLALSVIVNLIFIVRSLSSTSTTAHPESNTINQTNLTESIAMKVSSDEVAIILSYLPRSEILRARQLKIRHPGNGRTFSVGEDPDEKRVLKQANESMLNINPISNFSKLLALRIDSPDLNGRYPVLFNFPLLQKLTITKRCRHLKWDFHMLSGCPLLEELVCEIDLTENISSLRTLKNTLQKVKLSKCSHIHGNFMDLADFPRLIDLDIESTAVTGDIRHIGEDDFPSLVTFLLPSTVIGGMDYEFQRISDVPDFMDAIYPFLYRTLTKQGQGYHMEKTFGWKLSSDSPDWYWPDEESDSPLPPFCLRLIKVGPRLGRSWRSDCYYRRQSCLIYWLGSKPNRDSDDYETFNKELMNFTRLYGSDFNTYIDYLQPPTEEEYQRLFEE